MPLHDTIIRNKWYLWVCLLWNIIIFILAIVLTPEDGGTKVHIIIDTGQCCFWKENSVVFLSVLQVIVSHHTYCLLGVSLSFLGLSWCFLSFSWLCFRMFWLICEPYIYCAGTNSQEVWTTNPDWGRLYLTKISVFCQWDLRKRIWTTPVIVFKRDT